MSNRHSLGWTKFTMTQDQGAPLKPTLCYWQAWDTERGCAEMVPPHVPRVFEKVRGLVRRDEFKS